MTTHEKTTIVYERLSYRAYIQHRSYLLHRRLPVLKPVQSDIDASNLGLQYNPKVVLACGGRCVRSRRANSIANNELKPHTATKHHDGKCNRAWATYKSIQAKLLPYTGEGRVAKLVGKTRAGVRRSVERQPKGCDCVFPVELYTSQLEVCFELFRLSEGYFWNSHQLIV